MLEVHIHGHTTGLIMSLFATTTCFNSIARVVSADDRRTVISCHSTGVRSILSFRLDSLNSMIARVVSADAGSPHPWPYDWTPSCFMSLFATTTCFNSIARVVSADARRTVISCHSTGVRSILSFRLDSLNSMIARVVSADAGSPHPWPFDWTPSCFIFVRDRNLFQFDRSSCFGG